MTEMGMGMCQGASWQQHSASGKLTIVIAAVIIIIAAVHLYESVNLDAAYSFLYTFTGSFNPTRKFPFYLVAQQPIPPLEWLHSIPRNCLPAAPRVQHSQPPYQRIAQGCLCLFNHKPVPVSSSS